jgi:hypothetical protein
MEYVCFLARVVIVFSSELEGMSKILRNPKEGNIFSPFIEIFGKLISNLYIIKST